MTSSNDQSYADRRTHSRIELMVQPTAALCVPGGPESAAAPVLDISLGGARIQSDVGLISPDNLIDLMIEGVRARAEIVWRSATEIGLRFVEQAGQAVVGIFERVLTREYVPVNNAAS